MLVFSELDGPDFDSSVEQIGRNLSQHEDLLYRHHGIVIRCNIRNYCTDYWQ